MTDMPASARVFHPAHTLVSWPAVIAGAAVAIAVGAMLNLLGVALGAASLNAFDLVRGEGDEFSALAGIWIALSNLVGLFVGGFVASRSAKYVDHHRGLLIGLSVWAVAFLVALFLAGASASGGVLSVLSGAGEAVAERNATLPPLGDSPGMAPAIGADAAETLPVPLTGRQADAMADHTATVALWAFLTMLLGAAGAVFGSRYGLTRHGWESGPHLSTNDRADQDGEARFEAPRGPRPSTGL